MAVRVRFKYVTFSHNHIEPIYIYNILVLRASTGDVRHVRVELALLMSGASRHFWTYNNVWGTTQKLSDRRISYPLAVLMHLFSCHRFFDSWKRYFDFHEFSVCFPLSPLNDAVVVVSRIETPPFNIFKAEFWFCDNESVRRKNDQNVLRFSARATSEAKKTEPFTIKWNSRWRLAMLFFARRFLLVLNWYWTNRKHWFHHECNYVVVGLSHPIIYSARRIDSIHGHRAFFRFPASTFRARKAHCCTGRVCIISGLFCHSPYKACQWIWVTANSYCKHQQNTRINFIDGFFFSRLLFIFISVAGTKGFHRFYGTKHNLLNLLNRYRSSYASSTKCENGIGKWNEIFRPSHLLPALVLPQWYFQTSNQQKFPLPCLLIYLFTCCAKKLYYQRFIFIFTSLITVSVILFTVRALVVVQHDPNLT